MPEMRSKEVVLATAACLLSAGLLYGGTGLDPIWPLLWLAPVPLLAIALRLRPDLASKIERLVFMGGSIEAKGNVTGRAEFNFWFDPEAAQAVLRSAIPEKIMFGLDITNHAPVRKDDYEQIVAVKTPITELYAALSASMRQGGAPFQQRFERLAPVIEKLRGSGAKLLSEPQRGA